MNDSTRIDGDLANVSPNLTALEDARARVRIDGAERDRNTVGYRLGAYRRREGLTEQELADRLGIDLPSLAALSEERQPGTDDQEMGLDQLADLYNADRLLLLEAFERGREG